MMTHPPPTTRTTTTTAAEGYAAIMSYNRITGNFDLINSVSHHQSTGKMEVDVPVEGIEGLLRQILVDAKDHVTEHAKINGKRGGGG